MKGEINAMMKIEIVMDEDKIRAEGEYAVEEIKRCVCSPFESKKLRRVETTDGSIVYCDRDRNDEHVQLLLANVSLTDEVWFAHYVKKWMCTDDNDEEDVLATAKKIKVGAFA